MKHSLGKDRLEHSVFLREQVRNLWEGGVRRLWYCKSVQSNASASMPDVHDGKHTRRRDYMPSIPGVGKFLVGGKFLRCVVLIFQATHTSIVYSPRYRLAAGFSDFFALPAGTRLPFSSKESICDDTLSSIILFQEASFYRSIHHEQVHLCTLPFVRDPSLPKVIKSHHRFVRVDLRSTTHR